MATRKILLVEDNPDDEALTVRALRQHSGAEVEVARDGVEALDYLLGRGDFADPRPAIPDLVLLDIKLPKVDGLEVLRELRAEASTHLLPVIILTSSDEESDLISGYANGVNSYVRKPVDFAEFSRAVQQLGLYWLNYNEPPPMQR